MRSTGVASGYFPLTSLHGFAAVKGAYSQESSIRWLPLRVSGVFPCCLDLVKRHTQSIDGNAVCGKNVGYLGGPRFFTLSSSKKYAVIKNSFPVL